MYPQSAVCFDTKTLQMRIASTEEQVINKVLQSLPKLFSDWTFEKYFKLANKEHMALIIKNINEIESQCKRDNGDDIILEIDAANEEIKVTTKVSREMLAAVEKWMQTLIKQFHQSRLEVDQKALVKWLLSSEGKERMNIHADIHGAVLSVSPKMDNRTSDVHKRRRDTKNEDRKNKMEAETKSLAALPSQLTLGFTCMTQCDANTASSAMNEELQAMLAVETWTNSPLREQIQHMHLKQIKENLCKEVEVEILITNDDIKVEGLKRDVKAVKSSIDSILAKLASDKPVAIAAAMGGADPSEAVLKTTLVSAKNNAIEYKVVEQMFMESCGGAHANILKIMKISNAYLEEENSRYKSQVMADLGIHSNDMHVERLLWHGTRATKLLSSLKFVDGNFGKEYSNGNGVYFSNSSLEALIYSSKASAWEGFIFLAKVVTGRCTTALEGDSLPKGFHCKVDNLSDPTGYTVYDLSAAYPEYLINCCWRGHI
ncbi:uncharacterized protein [Watersipora subatra]|uniref:uncharacterized protein n=1 Tax=Watersipora subatra TaxID=2589382 RepID=UPI00355AFFD5